jgi:hypothetical protein
MTNLGPCFFEFHYPFLGFSLEVSFWTKFKLKQTNKQTNRDPMSSTIKVWWKEAPASRNIC